jgi:hypothetical protein
MTYINLKRKDVRTIQVEQELMLHDPAVQKVYVLNPTAAIVWDLCDGAHTIDQMVAAVSTQFDNTTQANISEDVHKTLDWFSEYGLLEQKEVENAV